MLPPGSDLMTCLASLLPAEPGVWLAIAEPSLLANLQARLLPASPTPPEEEQPAWPTLVAVLDGKPKSRNVSAPPLRSLQADPLALPLRPDCLDGLLAVATLSRWPEPAGVLQRWTHHLRPGGRLLVVEPLVRSQTMRRLHRLVGGPRFARPPEEVTGLLLNAGFREVRQHWAGVRRPRVITWGRLLRL